MAAEDHEEGILALARELPPDLRRRICLAHARARGRDAFFAALPGFGYAPGADPWDYRASRYFSYRRWSKGGVRGVVVAVETSATPPIGAVGLFNVHPRRGVIDVGEWYGHDVHLQSNWNRLFEAKAAHTRVPRTYKVYALSWGSLDLLHAEARRLAGRRSVRWRALLELVKETVAAGVGAAAPGAGTVCDDDVFPTWPIRRI